MLDSYPSKPVRREVVALRRLIVRLLSELVILDYRRSDGRASASVEGLREQFFACPPDERAYRRVLNDALHLLDELQG